MYLDYKSVCGVHFWKLLKSLYVLNLVPDEQNLSEAAKTVWGFGGGVLPSSCYILSCLLAQELEQALSASTRKGDPATLL